ncbi:hypothetical protein [Geomonas agri]|uniref:hypothetical protein n=1 Tax=Geomonas agri TaxID=2873702 RepID=UPI001CD73031|nr:hypothetical protein [Geomonas agri]
MKFLSSLIRSLTRQNVLQATIVIMLVALALGCSKKPDVVGTWENVNVQELVEFKPDNSGVIQGKNQPALAFVWRETTPHSYSLEVDFQGDKKGLKAVVQEETLVLKSESGKETYRKRN